MGGGGTGAPATRTPPSEPSVPSVNETPVRVADAPVFAVPARGVGAAPAATLRAPLTPAGCDGVTRGATE